MSGSPLWAKDIERYVNSVPFGEVKLVIKRHGSKTRSISTKFDDSIAYYNNEAALRDLMLLVEKLEKEGANTALKFTLMFKKGIINLVIYHNVKQTSYEQEALDGRR